MAVPVAVPTTAAAPSVAAMPVTAAPVPMAAAVPAMAAMAMSRRGGSRHEGDDGERERRHEKCRERLHLGRPFENGPLISTGGPLIDR